MPRNLLSWSTANAAYFQNTSIARFAATAAAMTRRTARSSPRSRKRWIRRPAAKLKPMLPRNRNRISCAPQT